MNEMIGLIAEFLMKNGFKEQSNCDCGNENVYSNKKCTIYINIFEKNYCVLNRETKCTTFSSDLNIYWLIGILTYYGYIAKNYKQ